MLLNAVSWVLTGLALGGAAYTVAAVELVRRFLEKSSPAPTPPSSVTLLKPLFRAEPGLKENLESFLAQDYHAPTQMVFGVQDEHDPAIAVARDLMRANPGSDIALVIDPCLRGTNPKVSNLINMLPHAKYETLILSDSDIRVKPDWLRAVTTCLEQPQIGVVTCLYAGRGRGLWSRLSAMGTNYEFLPNAVFGRALGLAEPCFGSTIALKRSVLKEIGGFEAYANILADDYEIGRAVRQKGLHLSIPALTVEHLCYESSLRDLFRHELRWSRTIRNINPAGHFGSIVTQPVPLALLGAGLSGFAAFGFIGLLAAFGARLYLKWRMDRVLDASTGPAWLLPFRDVLSFSVLLISFFGGKIEWRGARFRLTPNGALSQF